MISLPPLNGLRAFDAAGRHLTFRAAAEELGVTQGAVAQHVRQLESHLGLPLFERHAKGLAFTASGRAYHARVAAAFEELRSATRTLRPDPDKVLISVTPSFASKWLIPNLPDFSDRHPDCDLRILATDKVSSFHGDGIDLAVRLGHPPFGASLDADRLFRQDVIAVAAPALVAAQGVPLTLDALVALPKLHDTHDLWPEFLGALGITDRGARGLRLSHAALAIDAAIAGQGVALVSTVLAARDIATGNLVQVTPQHLRGKQDFYLLAPRSPKRSEATEAVRQWLFAKAEDNFHVPPL